IRTADGAGMVAVIMEKSTTDPYQDKVLRASKGSGFHLLVMSQELDKFITQFNGRVNGTAVGNSVGYKEVTSSDPFALL
ncbi:RNA methyltransferase, partial [Staphylococcus aureus]